jgi:hypothetical protein
VPGAAFDYNPRKPEETVLYGVVTENLKAFLALRQERERPVPRFVEHEFREYSLEALASPRCATVSGFSIQ